MEKSAIVVKVVLKNISAAHLLNLYQLSNARLQLGVNILQSGAHLYEMYARAKLLLSPFTLQAKATLHQYEMYARVKLLLTPFTFTKCSALSKISTSILSASLCCAL